MVSLITNNALKKTGTKPRQVHPAVMAKLFRGDVLGALMDGATKVVNNVSGNTSPVIERMAKVLMQTNPKLAKEMLEGGMNKLSRSDQARAKLLSVLTGGSSSATPRILGEHPREPLMITIGGKGR